MRDLIDLRGVMQGQAGYSNRLVQAGDTIIAIDGQYVEHQDIGFLHKVLKGDRMTAVSITLKRKNGAQYNIQVIIYVEMPRF